MPNGVESIFQIQTTTAETFAAVKTEIFDLIDMAGCTGLSINFSQKDQLVKSLVRFLVLERPLLGYQQ